MSRLNILVDAIEEIEKPPSTLCEGGVHQNFP
jgi:hypothetical protein